MDKMTRRAAIVGSALVLSACATVTPESSVANIEKISPPRTVIINPRAEQSGTLLSLRYDDDFSEDSLYWQPPTTLTIQNNGDYYVYVARLGNWRRMPGLIDQGWTVNFGLNITFYDGDNGAGRCAGVVLYSADLGIRALRYKTDGAPATRSGNDPNFARLAGAFRCTEVRVYWR
jgi:hypothetical protein